MIFILIAKAFEIFRINFYQGRTSPFICQKVPELSILRSLMRATRPAALSGGSIRPLCPVISKIFFYYHSKNILLNLPVLTYPGCKIPTAIPFFLDIV